MDLQGGAVGGSNLNGVSLAGGAYWKGADGNFYYKTSSGVKNIGTNASQAILAGANQISDPNPPMKNTALVTGTPSGTSSTPAKVVNTAAVNATQQALDSLGTELGTRNANVDQSLSSVMGGYDQEAATNHGDYQQESDTNSNNLQKNKQNALVAAAQGKRGLYSTLAAMGALGGDGAVLANRTVTDAANDDIGTAADTFGTNQVGLDKSIRNFDDEDRKRRAQAQTDADNQKVANEGDVLAKKQTYYQKMADLFNEGGNTAQANNYLGLAGGLNNDIATKTAVKAAPLTARSAAYTPDDLDQYLAGAGDMTVGVAAGDGGVADGSSTLLAARAKDKDKKLAGVTA